jgi:hypothetical protein
MIIILLSITAVSLHASLASNVFSKVLVSSLVSFAFILLNIIVIPLISTLSGVEFDEKNNAYFLGLEKKRQIKKSITKLLDGEGNIITNQRHFR